MTLLQLGDKFPHGAPSIPLLVSLSQSPLTCVFTFSNLMPREIDAFSTGNVEFSFCQPNEKIISFNTRINGLTGWCDAQYSPSADLSNPTSTVIDTKLGMHTPVVLTLVEGTTGLIKGIRIVSVSHPFVYRLNQALEQINSVKLTEEEYLEIAQSVLDKYSTHDLVKMSKHIERGGQTVN